MPSTMRPPEISSAVAALRASNDGCRNVAGETSVPSSSFVVRAARPASVAHASSTGRVSSEPEM